MNQINIKSLLQANASLKEDAFNSFLRHYGINIKDAEIEDITSLVNIIDGCGGNIKDFDKFYVGYKIPQIGKEFDLLRFGKNYILNIEIKCDCTEEKRKNN